MEKRGRHSSEPYLEVRPTASLCWQHIIKVGFLLVLALSSSAVSRAVDIAPLVWTPRPEWINVKTDSRVSPHAIGDGVADDTAAIQSALDLMNNNPYVRGTIYFPAGTYKISSTLQIGVTNYRLVGCGLNTVIKWAGPTGHAMIWPNGGGSCEYLGFVWDGNNTAGCAFSSSLPPALRAHRLGKTIPTASQLEFFRSRRCPAKSCGCQNQKSRVIF